MGEVLDVEAVDDWSLDAATLQGLAGLGGIQDTSRVRYGARGYRVRYRTQDRGHDAEATMILAVPDTAGTFPTLLYLHPSTGFDDFCAPSGRDITWAGVPLGLAGMGYVVAAPDYLGQNGFGEEAAEWHPYLVAEATAVASLDSVRAAWAYAGTAGVTASKTTLLLGASQGAAGALWSERFAPQYLPDADIVGNVMSVPPFDLVNQAAAAKETLSVSTIGLPLAFVAMQDWYDVDARLDEVLMPGVEDRALDTMATDCPSAELPDDITAVEQVYTEAWRTTYDAEHLDDWDPLGCMLAESSVGFSPIERASAVPSLVVLGGADDVSLVDVQRAATEELCAEGESIVAWECEGLGHTDTVRATFDAQLDFLAARAAGEAVTEPVCGGVEVRSCE